MVSDLLFHSVITYAGGFEMCKKINVLLVSIVNRNLGDTVIADTARYYIEKAISHIQNITYQVFQYNIYVEDPELLRLADLIIFAGGGLIKYKQEFFYEKVSNILDVAEEKQIPVFFNGVGVEGYEEEDERCQALKQRLNYSCVKGITGRDDIHLLKDSYITNTNIRVKKAIDSAIAVPEVYNIRRDKNSKVIGLGIIRDQIFQDYGIDGFDKERQISLWLSMINEIESCGYEWQLFTNGLRADYCFALEILKAAGKENERERYLVDRAIFTKQLIQTIAGYKGIIAGRMHSNIIAYALKVPSVGLVWNEKLSYWGERIGYPERFIKPEQMDASYIVSVLIESMKKGVRKRLSVCAYEYVLQRELRYFLRENGCFIQKEQKKTYPWQKKLVAVGLGGQQLQYTNMNHLGTMQEKWKDGFRKFEADVRLTSDGKMVCVNGWSDTTYDKYNMDSLQHEEGSPSYDEFMQKKAYGVFESCDMQQLISKFSTLKGATLFLDIGRPNKKTLEGMVLQMNEIFSGNEELMKKIIIRVQTKYDVSYLKEQMRLKCRIAYYLPEREKWEAKKITLENLTRYCKKEKINLITMSNKTYDKEIADALQSAKIKVLLFTTNSYTSVVEALHLGADFIGTQHLSIKMLKKLAFSEDIMDMGNKESKRGKLDE